MWARAVDAAHRLVNPSKTSGDGLYQIGDRALIILLFSPPLVIRVRLPSSLPARTGFPPPPLSSLRPPPGEVEREGEREDAPELPAAVSSRLGKLCGIPLLDSVRLG